MRKLLAFVASLALVFTGLSAQPSWASAPADGNYPCATGHFTISGGVVTSHSACAGPVVVPEGVTAIRREAFALSGITSISLPNSLTSIGAAAFGAVSTLTSINIPAGVTVIEAYTFYGATSLSSVTFPQGLVLIEECAFFNARSLATLSLPNSLTRIYFEAFRGASSLTTLVLPNGLQYLGEYAFADTSSLTSVTFPSSLTRIEDAAFDSATALTSVNIPNGVTYIGVYSFYGNTSLESITIPSSVVEIGEEAFMESTSLANVYFLGNAPGTMGPRAFSTVANGARARILPGATGFGADGGYWNGLLVQRDLNPPNNIQQTSVQPAPLPSFSFGSRPIISANGQSLTLTGRYLDSVVSLKLGNKEVEITKKSFGEVEIGIPALGEGLHDLGIVHTRGASLLEGFVRAVKPYAQKRTIQVTAFKAGSPTAASVAALKKSYLAGTPANVLSCVAKVAANASAKDVNLAAKSAKTTCLALTTFSSFINTVNVQVTKTGRTGSKLVVAVTLDRTLTGK